VPFQRFGLPNSSFHLQQGQRRLRLALGRRPFIVELRDAEEAWQLLRGWMERLGLPLIDDSPGLSAEVGR
jgi:hypothetical protein